ncbi:MAG: uroporphyrinogen-III synthase [Methanomassiliicoccales archaeon]
MRPKEKIGESIEIAKRLGFEPMIASPLRVEVVDSSSFDAFLESLFSGEIDFVIVTSAIGARAVIELATKRRKSEELVRVLNSVYMVAIGPETARALESAGIRVSILPNIYSSDGIAELMSSQSIAGKRIFILRSDRGEKKLVGELVKSGAKAVEVIVYSLVPNIEDPDLLKIIDAVVSRKLEVLAFTSPLSAKVFVDVALSRYREDVVFDALAQSFIAAIGNPTRMMLESYNIRVDIVPPEATFECLLQTIKKRISYDSRSG